MNFLSIPLVPILAEWPSLTFFEVFWTFLTFSTLLFFSLLFFYFCPSKPFVLSFLPFFSSFPFSPFFAHLFPLLFFAALSRALLCSGFSFFFFTVFDISCPSMSPFHSFLSFGCCLPISTHWALTFSALLCHSPPPSTPLSCSPLCYKAITMGQTPNFLSLLFCPSSLLLSAFLYPSPHLSPSFHLPLASGYLELSLFNFSAILQNE